ncbi:MAG: DNA methyltransferase [Pseudohongiellaceae bacterium]
MIPDADKPAAKANIPIQVADGAKITAALEKAGYPFDIFPDGWVVNGESDDVLEAMIAENCTVDGVVIDPPWMSVATAYPVASISGAKDKRKRSGKQWSDILTLKMAFRYTFEAVRQLQNDAGATAIFCGTVSSSVFCQWAYKWWPRLSLVPWEKNMGRVSAPFVRLCEYVLFCSVSHIHDPWGGDYEEDVLRGDYHALLSPAMVCDTVPMKQRIHPAEKPVDLLERLVRITTPPNGVVLDSFAGSCSVMRAARNIGRRFLMIEADEELYARGVELATKYGVRKKLDL